MKYYNEYIEKAHCNALEKGFYDDKTIPLEDRFFLIQTEIGECGEAWRSDRWAQKEDVERYEEHYNDLVEEDGEICYFISYIKSTVQDELADVMIRLFDIAGFLGIRIDKEYQISIIPRETFFGNLSNIQRLVFKLLDKIKNNIWNEWAAFHFFSIFRYIEEFAVMQEIELYKHIDLKMQHNKTREHKHGKKM